MLPSEFTLISLPHSSISNLVNKFFAEKMSSGVRSCHFLSTRVHSCPIRIPNDPARPKTRVKIPPMNGNMSLIRAAATAVPRFPLFAPVRLLRTFVFFAAMPSCPFGGWSENLYKTSPFLVQKGGGAVQLFGGRPSLCRRPQGQKNVTIMSPFLSLQIRYSRASSHLQNRCIKW